MQIVISAGHMFVWTLLAKHLLRMAIGKGDQQNIC